MTLPALRGTTSWNPTTTRSGPGARPPLAAGQLLRQAPSHSVSLNPGGGRLPATLYVPACVAGVVAMGMCVCRGGGVTARVVLKA
jgi:hypothetical protein